VTRPTLPGSRCLRSYPGRFSWGGSFVPLEAIAANLDQLFPGMEVVEHWSGLDRKKNRKWLEE
jgi:hypothetical protein